MAPGAPEEGDFVDRALRNWRQGDVTLDGSLEFVYLADLSAPRSTTSIRLADQLREQGEGLPDGPISLVDAVPGFVIVTQTCDVVRSSVQRPYIEVAPLVSVPAGFLEEVRRLRRPAFAYVPAMARQRLVADLDRVMTVEKAVVARWRRIPGWTTDDEARAFAEALARKRMRFAFPDDFVAITGGLQERLRRRHNRQNPEGAHLRALREIRVRAAPGWDADAVSLSFWFIKEQEPQGVTPAWSDWTDEWIGLIDRSGRYRIEFAVACRLRDLTAQDYIESDRLDLDSLSGP